MKNNFDKSPLWAMILETDSFKNFNINNFKDSGANSKITEYGHSTHGIFFLKNIIYHMAKKFKSSELVLLEDVPKRDTGGGLSINFNNQMLDLDYLLALDEVLFLADKLKIFNSVMEIGAGYGRTCHSILSLFPNISRYDIVDFPQMLNLSKQYLKAVTTQENFEKINFIPVGNLDEYKFDLVINIDSMQEMDEQSVQSYLKYIKHNALAFYTKNTVCKFEPSLCGWENTEGSKRALESGILKDVLDIFSPSDLTKAKEKFIQKFSPGDNWIIEKHAETMPWSHLYQALFVREK